MIPAPQAEPKFTRFSFPNELIERVKKKPNLIQLKDQKVAQRIEIEKEIYNLGAEILQIERDVIAYSDQMVL